jgi:hypothetical protein
MFKNVSVIHSTVAEANSFLGTANTLSVCLEDCTIRFHDGCTCGGKILGTPEFDPTDILASIAALEAINPVVDTEVIPGTFDILVTYQDGSTETLDLPEFSGTTDADGNVTFDLNGTPFGPFDVAPDDDTFVSVVSNADGSVTITDTDGVEHVVSGDLIDDDTFTTYVDNGDDTITLTFADGSTKTIPCTDTAAIPVDNGDGTVTVTYANGSSYTYTTGLVVDTDTVVTYDFQWAPDGSVTITGSDGSTFTGPPNTVDTDTDTFATLSGQTITFADGSTLTVAASHADDDVETVGDGGSNLVDLSDPRNPTIRGVEACDGTTWDANSSNGLDRRIMRARDAFVLYSSSQNDRVVAELNSGDPLTPGSMGTAQLTLTNNKKLPRPVLVLIHLHQTEFILPAGVAGAKGGTRLSYSITGGNTADISSQSLGAGENPVIATTPFSTMRTEISGGFAARVGIIGSNGTLVVDVEGFRNPLNGASVTTAHASINIIDI